MFFSQTVTPVLDIWCFLVLFCFLCSHWCHLNVHCHCCYNSSHPAASFKHQKQAANLHHLSHNPRCRTVSFFIYFFCPTVTLNHRCAGCTIRSHLALEWNARHSVLVVSQKGRRYYFFGPLCIPLFPSASPLSPWQRLREVGEARLAAVDPWHLPGSASLCHRPAISCQSDSCH